jgi:hypothetical protein
MGWIGQHGDYHKNHILEVTLAAVEDLRKAGCTSFSLVGQCWGVLMAAKVVSEEGTPFVSAGGPHPSFISLETTKDVKTPMILLASKDEADMVRCFCCCWLVDRINVGIGLDWVRCLIWKS